MMTASRRTGVGIVGLGLSVAAFLGCAGPDQGVTDPGRPQTAVGGGGSLAVTAADPAFGYQGETAKAVTITGSGFAPGAQASWQRNGVTDPDITVLATQYISSTQLIATITIAPDATISLYDVAVTQPSRKGGIGTDMAVGPDLFEVTDAMPIAGTGILRAANERGELAGCIGGPCFWSATTGLIALPAAADGGGVRAIDEAGQTMTGFDKVGIPVIPVWNRVGGVWQHDALPKDPASTHGSGQAIASDPSTGIAVFIVGAEEFPGKKRNSVVDQPRVWRAGPGGWERVPLPSLAADGSGAARDVNAAGQIVGTSSGRAVIWEPDGTGGWTIAYLPGTEGEARGITAGGDLIAGGAFAYWTRQVGGGWSLSYLPVPCSKVAGVDDLGRIYASYCQRTSKTTAPAVFLPPYTGPPVFLGTLPPTRAANLEGYSRRGSWIVGQISSGVYWRPF